MSTIAFNWLGGNPPSQDVYTTRRGESRYHTLRYWMAQGLAHAQADEQVRPD